MKHTLSLSLLASLMLAQCGGEVSTAPARVVVAAPSPAQAPSVVAPTAWLWSGAGEAARTVELAPDGTVRATESGIVMHTRSDAWRVVREGVTVRTAPCDMAFGEGPAAIEPAGEGTSERVTLRRERDGAVQVVYDPAHAASQPDEEPPHTLTETVSVRATVGPYLFLRVDTQAYVCGAAHENAAARAIVWDVRAGHAVDLASAVEDLGAARDAAWTALEASDRAQGGGVLLEDLSAREGVDLGEMLPRYDRSGELRFGYRMAVETCFACGDGEWSSYTTTTELAGRVGPAVFAPWRAAPTSVVRFLAAHPEVEARGWSQDG